MITSVEADCVTILTDDGGARIDLAVLPPEIQKQLNYNPLLAKRASDKRQNEEALYAASKNAEKTAIRQKNAEAHQNSLLQQEQAAVNIQKAQDDADRKGRIAQYDLEIADYEWKIQHLESLRKEDALHTNDPELKADESKLVELKETVAELEKECAAAPPKTEAVPEEASTVTPPN